MQKYYLAPIAIFVLIVLAFALTFSRFYNLNKRLLQCGSYPNNSTQEVKETSRLFINIPKYYYPDVELTIEEHGATAGNISNGGEYGSALGADDKPECWSYYFEFNGSGSVDIISHSGTQGIPDYRIHFLVR